jgi:GH24 family phage-related lysozyme (muramidase)
LEYVGTNDALRLLDALAGGMERAWQTRAAKASRQRLVRRRDAEARLKTTR